MLNANSSNTASIAQQLMGLSFDEIVAKFEQQHQVIAQKDEVIKSSQQLNEKLTFELAYLKRLKFGKKSEGMGQ